MSFIGHLASKKLADGYEPKIGSRSGTVQMNLPFYGFEVVVRVCAPRFARK